MIYSSLTSSAKSQAPFEYLRKADLPPVRFMLMPTTRSIASLSLDLDNKWSYLKIHGDPGWESFPSYLDVVVPRVVEFLRARNLTITVFIVGQDAALEKNQEALASIATAGHEIGSHSFQHDSWLHLYSEQQIDHELARAECSIECATGKRPRGFRGPGFSLSTTVLRTLVRRGYLYDASTFPTFLGPLARAYYFMTARLTTEEKNKRKALFGSVRDVLQPLTPYRWQLDTGELIELPVTTMPLLRVPIHLSYVLYVGGFAPALALRYFHMALRLCRMTGTQPSILLHPLDFLGYEDATDLSFFPGMRLPREKKLAMVDSVLRSLSDQFTVVTMQQHASDAARRSHLREIIPSFQIQNDRKRFVADIQG